MAQLIGIGGDAGRGKSTSLSFLNPEETFVINVASKALPFKGSKKNYTPLVKDKDTGKWTGNLYNCSSYDKIAKVFQIISKDMPHIKQVICDDFGYLMAFDNMERALDKGFDKFTQMGQSVYNILSNAISLREDLKIFIMMHIENEGDALNPKWKLKTTGKLIDKAIGIDGLFTILLYAEVIPGDEGGRPRYVFRTNTIDGSDSCKSPLGMFDDLYIDNNLTIVIEKIDEYNEG